MAEIQTLEATSGYAPENPALLVQGMEGPTIKKLQTQLNLWGFDVGADGVDGKFGPNTYAAVVAMQQFLGDIAVDGKYGPETNAAVNADLAKGEAGSRLYAHGLGNSMIVAPSNSTPPHDEGTTDAAAAAEPFYKQPWFFALAGVGIVLALSSKTAGPSNLKAMDDKALEELDATLAGMTKRRKKPAKKSTKSKGRKGARLDDASTGDDIIDAEIVL